MGTENIEKFLQTAYSDEKLAALLAHAQDGKLGWASCCCLIGIPNAKHALQEAPGLRALEDSGIDTRHYHWARMSDFDRMWTVEHEFKELGKDDAERREKLTPLIFAEQERRIWQRFADSLPDISLEEQHRLEEIDAERESLPEPTYGRRL